MHLTIHPAEGDFKGTPRTALLMGDWTPTSGVRVHPPIRLLHLQLLGEHHGASLQKKKPCYLRTGGDFYRRRRYRPQRVLPEDCSITHDWVQRHLSATDVSLRLPRLFDGSCDGIRAQCGGVALPNAENRTWRWPDLGAIAGRLTGKVPNRYFADTRVDKPGMCPKERICSRLQTDRSYWVTARHNSSRGIPFKDERSRGYLCCMRRGSHSWRGTEDCALFGARISMN